MLTALIEGIILGITLSFLIGPSFIALLQTSIHRGLYSGLQFSVGVALSDLTLVALSYFGALHFLSADQNQFRIGLIGGLIVIGFGVVTYTRKHKIAAPVNHEIKRKTESFFTGRFFKYVSKGYFMNIFNPFLLIFWIGIMGLVSSKYTIPSKEIILFFAGAIGAVLTTDILKCLAAHQIKKKLNTKVLTLINRIVGLSLVVFGMVLIARVVLF